MPGRTRDLALSPALVHWESESATTASSPTGQVTPNPVGVTCPAGELQGMGLAA